MGDRAAATVGFVLAGVALAGGLAGWPGGLGPAGAALGGIALVAFGLRRYDRVAPGPVDAIAGGAGLAAVALAVVAVVGPAVGGGTAELAAGTAVTALGGLGTAAMAVADWRAIDGPGLAERATSTVSATAIGLAGLLAIVVWSAVIGGVYRAVAGDVDPSTGAVLSSLALGIATVSVAWLYLQGTGRGRGFVDVRWPDRRDVGYVVAGLPAAVGLNLGIEALFRAVGLASARHSLYDVARQDPGMLLVLIPLTILLIGPGEELLYRNVVQKSLYEAFSRPGAVLVASAIFAAAHVPAYSSAGATPLSVLNTLSIVFVLAVVLGVAYDRTRNVLVSALIHGGFNAIAFAATYVELAG